MTEDLFTRLARRAIALQVDDRYVAAGEDAETLAFDRGIGAPDLEGEAPGPPVSEPAFLAPPEYRPESIVSLPVVPIASMMLVDLPTPEEPTRQGQAATVPHHPADTPHPAPRPGRAALNPGPGYDPGQSRPPLRAWASESTLSARQSDAIPERSENAFPTPVLRPPTGPDMAADHPRTRAIPDATTPIPADVTIGRLEIRVRSLADTTSKAAAARHIPLAQAVSLADYLRQREGGAR